MHALDSYASPGLRKTEAWSRAGLGTTDIRENNEKGQGWGNKAEDS